VHGYLLAIDVDLDSGGFRLAHNAPLGVVEDVAGPAALSVDGGTLYVLTNADTVTAFDTATFARGALSVRHRRRLHPAADRRGPAAVRALRDREQEVQQRHPVDPDLRLAGPLGAAPASFSTRSESSLLTVLDDPSQKVDITSCSWRGCPTRSMRRCGRCRRAASWRSWAN